MDLDRFFSPRAIVVVGANETPYGGSFFLRNLKDAGYEGGVYPVNPRLAGKTLVGWRVYGSLDDVPGEVDLAIVAVPARATPTVAAELAKRGVPFVHVFSSGFSEAGRADLEEDLRRATVDNGARLVGPNCLGGYNPRARTAFSTGLSTVSGDVGVVSQSGGLAVRLALNGPSRGFHFSKIASVGNQADLDLLDFLAYFGEDHETRIVAAYVENVKRDGDKLVPLLKAITTRKPVVIWKAGFSEGGKQAVASHTGGLAGDLRLWRAMARQTGAILVEGFQSLVETIQALKYLPLPETRGVAVLTAGGGMSVELTDACERNGLAVPRVSEEGQEALGEFVPDVNTNLKNPLDLGAAGLDPTTQARAIRVLASEPAISSFVVVKDPERFGQHARSFGVPDYEDRLVEEVAAAKPPDKPVVFCNVLLTETEQALVARARFEAKLLRRGIVSIDDADAAARCLRRLWEYGRYLSSTRA
ncbi:MAG: CoA-binding protein [Promethearchaeota archaeon]